LVRENLLPACLSFLTRADFSPRAHSLKTSGTARRPDSALFFMAGFNPATHPENQTG